MNNQEAIRLIRKLFTMCEFTDAYGDPIDSDAYYEAVDMAISALQAQDSPKPIAESVQNVQNEDLISRKAAIEAFMTATSDGDKADWCKWVLERLPSAQPKKRTEERTETHACDLISRQAAIDALDRIGSLDTEADKKYARSVFEALPSAQPERTCVNCGRTMNNGGWYADGRTRCPIEEHYALPKDGYCHLWEKRNVTDDDYPERRENENR